MSADVKPVVVWRRPPKSGVSTPLVIFLHGRGADENDLIDISERLPRTFAYASVRAPVPLEYGGYTWFENRTPPRPPATASVRASVAAFRTWLNDPKVGAVSETCYLFGFSAGMMMAGALVIDDPKRFAGAVLLSGALALDGIAEAVPDRLSGLPVFYGRGTEDTVTPAPLVAQTESYLRERSGADLTLREYPIDHAISNRELDDIADWFASLD
jgi:phospholipase/carboxylesterase